MAEIKKIPPVAMTPHNIFVSGNHLVLYNGRKDTLFDVFTIPDLEWKFAAGIQGQGPQDFYQLERRLFLPTEKGFKIFSQPDRKLKEVWIQDSTLWIDNEHAVEFDIDKIPANGVLPLNDTSIIYWGGMDSDAEYLSLDSHSTPKELTSYPDWDKTNNQEEPIFKYVKNSVLNNDHTRFISFYRYFKRFRILNTDGHIIKDVIIKAPPYEEAIKEDMQDRVVYYHIPSRTNGKYIYVMCKNSTRAENRIQELQVWNWDGEPIARYDMDRKLTLFSVSDKEKKIYAVDGDTEDVIYVYDLPVP